MGRAKKNNQTTTQQEHITPQETSNKAETTILKDEEKLVSNRSRRRSLKNVQAGEVVTVRNKQNGAENRMAAEYAIKLVQRNPELYEVLK